MQTNKKTGVLLVNLGTPANHSVSAIKKYLKQFLSDPRVIDAPRWFWIPLLTTRILPKRAPRVAKLYQQIWTEQGSPLLAISRQQQHKLQQYLDASQENFVVELAMTYGEPSLSQAIDNLLQLDCQQLILLPLYPQYSSTTTAPVFDAFANALKTQRKLLPFQMIHSYHDDKNYIDALAKSIKERLQNDAFLLFSFHGIPQRYQTEGDFYAQHCQQSAQLVAEKLALDPKRWQLAFQSRFGKEPWLTPYTDEVITKLAQQGETNLLVVCPGFACDCLETLEEIDQENRALFLASGGKAYQYVPALNSSAEHIHMMAELIKKRS